MNLYIKLSVCVPRLIPGRGFYAQISSEITSEFLGVTIIPLYSLAFILHLWVCLVEYGGCTQSCLIFPSPDGEFLEDEGFGV